MSLYPVKSAGQNNWNKFDKYCHQMETKKGGGLKF